MAKGSSDEDERTTTARAAGALLLLGAASAIVLLPILPPHIDRGLALGQALLCCVAGLGMPLLPWSRWPRRALVAPVVFVLPVIFVGGGVVDGAIDYYALFLPLLFIYVGLAFPPICSFYMFGVCLIGMSVAMQAPQRPDVLPVVLLGLTLSTVSGIVLARQRRTERETYRAMQRLVETATTLGSAGSAQDVAELVAEAAADLLGADGVAVMLQQGPDGVLRVVVERVRPLPGFTEELLRPVLAGLADDAAVALTGTDRSHVPLTVEGRQMGAAFPLRIDHQVVGGVVVLRAARRALPTGSSTRTVVTLAAEAGRVLHRLVVTEDLVRSATVDRLTGVGNRTALEAALAACSPGDVVALVDLDHFKVVNDTQGHAAGDQVLREFGAMLRRCATGDQVLARYGGEEFVTLLPGVDEAEAEAHLDRLRRAWAGSGYGVTFSSGIARRHPDEPPGETLGRADVALYEAKRGGRDRDVVAAPGLRAPAVPVERRRLSLPVESRG